MTLKAWTFVGQTDGVAPSIANSDDFGEPAWSNVSGTAQLSYSTAQAFIGIVSMRVNFSAAASASTSTMDASDTASASAATHFYIYIDSYPSVDAQGPVAHRGGGAAGCRIQISSTGQIRNFAGGTTGTASTGTIPLNTWYRVESVVTGAGTSSTQIVTNAYAGNSTSAAFTVPTVSGATTANQVDLIRWTKSGGNTAISYWLSDLRQDIGASSEIGPTISAFSGSASYSGAGTLTSNATIGAAGSAALSGAGTMSAAGTPSAAGSVTASGSGTLSPSGVPAIAGTAALSGTGTLAAVGSPRIAGSATLAGAGTLTSSAGLSVAGAAALSGAGTLTAAASGAGFGTATLSGAGTLVATGVPSVPGVAALGGAGTLGTDGTPTPSAAVGLSGSGTLATVVVPNIAAALGLSGTGTLQAAAQGTSFGTGTLGGAGTLTAAAALSVAGAAGLSGVGALSAFGQVVGPFTASASLSGQGTLSAVAILVTLTGSVQLGSIGYLRDTGGSRVGFTPSNEMVTVAWLKAAVPYLGSRVATELPADNSSWSASGFTTVATTGGTPNTEVPVNEPVMSIDSWGVSLNSGRPPWNLAAQPAEAIKAAAVAHGLIPKILVMPAGFNQVRVFSVTPRTEPRRIPGDGAGYAHYQQDLHLRWVSA
jgi:hypothetical protein